MKPRSGRRGLLVAGLFLVLAGVLALLLGLAGLGLVPLPWGSPPLASATEPLLPPPPTAALRVDRPTPTATSAPLAAAAPQAGFYTLRQRLGVGAAGSGLTRSLAARLGLGWYLDWTASPDRFHSAEVDYLPMIRIRDGRPSLGGKALEDAVRALPGAVWLIGNEPDVKWQDNTPPDLYARLYHKLYGQLKALDPSCRVAIGGVSQPTPLRLEYLDRVLEAHRARFGVPMPVDVWNIHNFILREERGSWGVDIPPGLDVQSGALRDIADHDDLAVFRQQIMDFRRWMADRGQQDKPLIVTEYGVLMPADYGFPPQRVQAFMLATFDFLSTAADAGIGYPADGFRLVQRWCWYSLADTTYPTGNLLGPQPDTLSPLGQAFRRYAYGMP